MNSTILLLLVLNFAISVFNAWSVGHSWLETKAAGGFVRFMAWMGATMSAVGFSWSYLVIIAVAAGPDGFHRLPQPYVDAMFSLGYLVIIGPCIGSGLAITVDSWAHFWRKRTFGSGAVAAWNTAADVYNIYNAVRYVPSAWDNVRDLLLPKKRDSSSSSSSDNGLARLAILLAVMAVIGGVLTTAAIIRTVAQITARKRALQYAALD
jgi:hypothetical protein